MVPKSVPEFERSLKHKRESEFYTFDKTLTCKGRSVTNPNVFNALKSVILINPSCCNNSRLFSTSTISDLSRIT